MTEGSRDARANVLLDLTVANALSSELFDRELVRLGIRPIQVGVLLLISMYGPITPSGLEQESGLAGTTQRERIQSLVAGGYVRRTPNPDDRRSYFLETTSAGEAYLEQAIPALRTAERAIAEAVDMPVPELQDLIARIRAAARQLVWGVATVESR